MIIKHIAVKHGGMTTIVPDAVRVSTDRDIVTITRVNGKNLKRFSLMDVTEVISVHTRKQE